jgi:hypothetical protein
MSEYLKDPRANTFEGWIAALTIFSKYNKSGLQGRMDTASEHDILYLSTVPAPTSARHDEDEGETVCEWDEAVKEDVQILTRLGFHWTTEADCWAKFT